MQRRREAVGCLSRVMKAQADGAALLIQQTTKQLRWVDRSNGRSGERRRSITRRCRRSLSANLPLRHRRRAELRPAQHQWRRRAGLAVLAQRQTHLPSRQSWRVSDEVDISPPSPRLQWIFLLRRRLAAELSALPEATDG